MTLRDLLSKLEDLQQVHPEALDAQVWGVDMDGKMFHINYVTHSKRYKPHRVKLEE